MIEASRIDPTIIFKPHLVLVGGLPGSGKTTLRTEIDQAYFAGKTNFVGLDIDDFRVAELAHDKDAQLREAHARQLIEAQRRLEEHCAVALFATFRKRAYRQDRRAFGQRLGVDVLSYVITVPNAVRTERVLGRGDSTTSDIRTIEDLTRVVLGSDPYDDMVSLDGLESPAKLRQRILQDQIQAGLVM